VNFQFTLPDLGEGMAEVEVISWHVAEGDEVVSDQALLSVETDKLITDLPSPVAGRILELSVAEGEKVPVGQTLLIIDTVDTLGAESPRRDPPQATASSSHPASAVESPAQADTHRSAPTAARPRVKACREPDRVDASPSTMSAAPPRRRPRHAPPRRPRNRLTRQRQTDARLTCAAPARAWATGSR
jgi:pyruvate/2-oxoglutarate dehydrogenase complex dihydrolipoamide acyltransferase (E2) component